MALMVAQVPSYKWLPLTYQLSSRLGTKPPAKRYNPNDEDHGDAASASAAAAAAAANSPGLSAGSPMDDEYDLGPVTTFAEVCHNLEPGALSLFLKRTRSLVFLLEGPCPAGPSGHHTLHRGSTGDTCPLFI